MYRALCLSMAGALLCVLGGCAPQPPAGPVDMNEYIFETADRACREQTLNMMSGDDGMWNSELARRSYYDGCMKTYGISDERLREVWF